MSYTYDCLTVTIADNVALVHLDLPPVNAQNRLFRDELAELFDRLGESNSVRAIVLTGAGKVFSAGADLKERSGMADKPGAYTSHNRRVRNAFDAVADCPKPVIAAVNGAAIGAGCVLALCCDIIYVSEEAYFSMTEVNVGLAGGVAHVRRHFGESDARLLIFTARKFAGPDLKRISVASDCLPADQLLTTAMETAHEIASKSPAAMAAAKRSFIVTGEMPLLDGYKFEQTQTAGLADHPDTIEAQAAFRDKRDPNFERT